MDLLRISVAEVAGGVICHGFWGCVFVYLRAHLLVPAIATADGRLLSVVVWDSELVSPWSSHFGVLVASGRDDYWVAALAFGSGSWGCARRVRVWAGPPFLGWWLGVGRCHLIFLHLVVGVGGSVWWFGDGDWCFVLVPCYVGFGRVDCMLGEGVCMRPG